MGASSASVRTLYKRAAFRAEILVSPVSLVVVDGGCDFSTSGTAAGAQNVEDLVDQAMGSLDVVGSMFPTISHDGEVV